MAHWPRALVLVAATVVTCYAAEPAPTTPPKSAFDKAALEAYLRHLNLWNPQIQVNIEDPRPSAALPGFQDVKVKASLGTRSIETTYLVSEDGRKILQANVYDIGWNPFREDLGKLQSVSERSPGLGKSGATVVLVLFSDFQCSYCRQHAQVLRANLLKTYPEQVRLYFVDFPLEALHPWAKAAAEIGECVFQQKSGAFWDFHDWIFEKQGEITVENLKSKSMEWAAQKGMDSLQLSQCIDTHAARPAVDKDMDLGRQLSVASTPTMFVNGRRLTGTTAWNDLKAIIDREIEYQKTARNAGEDCGCEVALPSAPGAPAAPKPAALPAASAKP